MLSIDQLNACVEDTDLDLQHMNELYYNLDNKADGNCLFYAASQGLYGTPDKHEKIRCAVADYYKLFMRRCNGTSLSDANSASVLESQLRTVIEFDNVDDDGAVHTDNIRNDLVYGNMGDVIVISILYNTNVLLFHQCDKSIKMCPIKNAKSSQHLYLYLNEEHFECLVPRDYRKYPSLYSLYFNSYLNKLKYENQLEASQIKEITANIKNMHKLGFRCDEPFVQIMAITKDNTYGYYKSKGAVLAVLVPAKKKPAAKKPAAKKPAPEPEPEAPKPEPEPVPKEEKKKRAPMTDEQKAARAAKAAATKAAKAAAKGEDKKPAVKKTTKAKAKDTC